MPTFIVECYWPGITEEHVKQALALLSRAESRRPAGELVKSLGCILVPSDGMAIFLFEGPSTLRLMPIAREAGLPFDRIVESIHVGGTDGPSSLMRGRCEVSPSLPPNTPSPQRRRERGARKESR